MRRALTRRQEQPTRIDAAAKPRSLPIAGATQAANGKRPAEVRAAPVGDLLSPRPTQKISGRGSGRGANSVAASASFSAVIPKFIKPRKHLRVAAVIGTHEVT